MSLLVQVKATKGTNIYIWLFTTDARTRQAEWHHCTAQYREMLSWITYRRLAMLDQKQEQTGLVLLWWFQAATMLDVYRLWPHPPCNLLQIIAKVINLLSAHAVHHHDWRHYDWPWAVVGMSSACYSTSNYQNNNSTAITEAYWLFINVCTTDLFNVNSKPETRVGLMCFKSRIYLHKRCTNPTDDQTDSFQHFSELLIIFILLGEILHLSDHIYW